jgi:hypothetical protein
MDRKPISINILSESWFTFSHAIGRTELSIRYIVTKKFPVMFNSPCYANSFPSRRREREKERERERERERFRFSLWNALAPIADGTRTNFLTRDRAINHHRENCEHRGRYGFDVNRTNDKILTSE